MCSGAGSLSCPSPGSDGQRSPRESTPVLSTDSQLRKDQCTLASSGEDASTQGRFCFQQRKPAEYWRALSAFHVPRLLPLLLCCLSAPARPTRSDPGLRSLGQAGAASGPRQEGPQPPYIFRGTQPSSSSSSGQPSYLFVSGLFFKN